jgi:hypothetical protein
MAVYEVEMRVVEIHTYRVVAESSEEAVDLAWTGEPVFIEHVSMEVDDVTKTDLKEDFAEFSDSMKTINEAQDLLAEIKEDVQELKTELSDAEYYKLRGENADWLSGRATIPFQK